ncbi:hypothetical protein VD0004_g9614 [Verticillium dahliae]|nr:hypothetical protein VD0004_g9614 [Verticillium dahliae]PNH75631.1 hypothetical protein VD0001_g1907 [Verticillium dahliae]
MRDGRPSAASRGLTLPLLARYRIHKRLKDLEITERRQVGDAQDLLNRHSDASTSSGDFGYFRSDASELQCLPSPRGHSRLDWLQKGGRITSRQQPSRTLYQ